MSLINDQRKRAQQTVQQIKDLARAGDWVEAKRLADTLPSTPDNNKLRERIAKQLFIATGEVPSVMEGSMALFDADDEVATTPAPPPAAKVKRMENGIPSYMPIRIVGNLVNGIGAIMILIGVILAAAGIIIDSTLIATGITIIISGLFSMASGSMMKLFVDIAQNTFRTNNLLARLLEQDNS